METKIFRDQAIIAFYSEKKEIFDILLVKYLLTS